MSANLSRLYPLKVSMIFYLSLIYFYQSYAQLEFGNFRNFTEKDGLPGVEVNQVLTDRQGYIWTGTVNGLARYDGYTFKRFYFNPNDTNTIRGLSIWSIFEDRKGQIWVGSSPSYLNVYNPVNQKFRQYPFAHLVPHTDGQEIGVRTICTDDNGRMYFGIDSYYGETLTTSLLYKNENEEKILPFKIPENLPLQNIYRLKKDNKGNIWILSRTGISKIDINGALSRFRLLDDYFIANDDWPGDLIFDKAGHMWIISQRLKLFEVNLENQTYQVRSSEKMYKSDDYFWIPRKIVFDKNENIWIGTNAGLYFYNQKTKQISSFNSGSSQDLIKITIDDLCIDSFGTLWIGTISNGLYKYQEKALLKTYSSSNKGKNTITSGWVNAIYEAVDGRIWITTSGSDRTSGINILDPHTGDMKSMPYATIKDQNRIFGMQAIWENSPGEMYCAIHDRIVKFDEKTNKIQTVKIAGVPDRLHIFYRYTDTKGNVWLCSGNGLYKKDKNTDAYQLYEPAKLKGSNQSSNEVIRVLDSKKYGLWILTNNGLFLYNHTTDKIDRHGFDKATGDVFITQDINSLYEDPEGILWVGTWSGGLSRYNIETKKIKTYTRNEGLPSMSIQGILGDEKNHALWLSTFEGMSRFNKKTEQFNNFNLEDGIQGQLFADGAQLKTSGGLFLFGGSNGITIFNPNEIINYSIPPKVLLTDIKLFNKSLVTEENSIITKPLDETKELTFSHSQNDLSFEFLALHYSNPSQNKYSYILENYDKEWRDIGNQRIAFYPNLPPGQYTFKVKAANDKGVWNENGVQLEITITPPWWKTIWAYMGYALTALVLGYAFDRYWRQRLLNKEREKNQARELEQAKEIEKAYNTLKATQTQLIQSEKMASLGELTAGIAHEIQNPLNFVNNFSDVSVDLAMELKEEAEKPDMDKELIIDLATDLSQNQQKINHHGKRASDIVKSMLEHSRKSTGEKELTDVNALCDEYLRLAYHGMKAKDNHFNAAIETHFDPDLPKIDIIPQDIGRVILNLINNAFYAVNERSKKVKSNYIPTVSITTQLTADSQLQISVNDNGSGIPAHIKDKIFQPFFTTKPTGQGTGLGLSLSYDIVRAHGGELDVDTKEGEGSQFLIHLPIVN